MYSPSCTVSEMLSFFNSIIRHKITANKRFLPPDALHKCGLGRRKMSAFVCLSIYLSVRLSVCHIHVLCRNE